MKRSAPLSEPVWIRCDEEAIERAAAHKYMRRVQQPKPDKPSWERLAPEARESWKAGIRRVVRDLGEVPYG